MKNIIISSSNSKRPCVKTINVTPCKTAFTVRKWSNAPVKIVYRGNLNVRGSVRPNSRNEIFKEMNSRSRMDRPTEKPYLAEVPVPHKVNILAPNQIEFTKVQPPLAATTVRPAARTTFGTTLPASPVTPSQRYIQVPHVKPKELRKTVANEAAPNLQSHKPLSQERSTAKDFRKQISQRRKKGSANVVAASEIAAEIMPSSFIDAKPESRMDDESVEVVSNARLVMAENSLRKQRKVVKLYVPRNGKFSNGFEKRSGMMTNYDTQAPQDQQS